MSMLAAFLVMKLIALELAPSITTTSVPKKKKKLSAQETAIEKIKKERDEALKKLMEYEAHCAQKEAEYKKMNTQLVVKIAQSNMPRALDKKKSLKSRV